MKNGRYWAASAVAVLSLSGCGGGSGGTVSTPAPPPTNTTLTDLKYSQSFTDNAALLTGTWDTGTGTAIDGTSAAGDLTFSYDARTGDYTVAAKGRTQTFGAADITSQDGYSTVYKKTVDGRDYLTLLKPVFSGGASAQYVAMGYWQHNVVDASKEQATDLASFAYGLPTGAGMVPRSGAAAYDTDVFGLVTKPGEEPRSFQGTGQLSVDFAQGLFTTDTSVDEYGLVTGAQTSGGGIELRAGGSLSAADGSFTGHAVYGGWYGQSWGTLDGRFYGPKGQELGATFHTANGDGMVAVGSLIGAQDANLTPDNQTLTGLTHQQLFYTRNESLVGSLTWLDAETFDLGMPVSDMGGGRFTIADKVASANPNFVAYAKTVDNSYYGKQDITLELYKPGAANSEVALTYASFGHWTGKPEEFNSSFYFTYGFATGSNYLAARTGSAHYEGVAYGTGLNADGSARYDVKGTSRFDVDFSAQSFGGGLTLAGVEQTSGAQTDFGSFGLTGTLAARTSSLQGTYTRDGANPGTFDGLFYGPDGQEIAGTFLVNTPPGAGDPKAVQIQGAAVAARK